MNNLKITIPEKKEILEFAVESEMYKKIPVDIYENNLDLKEYYYRYGYLCVFHYTWKNVDAEYKGVYLDSQYFTFSKKSHAPVENYMYLNQEAVEKYCLNNEELYQHAIKKADGIINYKKEAAAPCKEIARRHLFLDRNQNVDKQTIQECMKIVKMLYPNIYGTVEEYFNGNNWINGYSFILRNDIFDELAEWVFNILNVLSRKYSGKTSSILLNVNLEQIGYLLIESYLYFMMQTGKYNLKEANLVNFIHTSKEESICPAFSENNISILLVSSEYYMPYTVTCIWSIIENMSPYYNYDILVMQSSLSDESKKILKEMCENISNLEIRPVDLKRHLFKYKLNVSERITKDIFYRTIAPFVLTNYEKMVVLDTDLVVNRDIAKLYSTDLEEYCVAATRDIVIAGFLNGANKTEQEYYFNECVLSNPFDYINTGVMVQNYSKIREKYECQKFMKFFQEKVYHVQEQDCMNLLLDGEIKFIDIRWNVNSYNYSRKKYTIENAPRERYLEYLEARKNPYIMHWPGSVKPWDTPDVDMARYFWKYARKAPLYEVVLLRLIKGEIGKAIQKHEKEIEKVQTVAAYTDSVDESSEDIKKLNVRLFPYNSRRRNFISKIYHRYIIKSGKW